MATHNGNRPTVSVVITTRDRPGPLAAAIESVVALDTPDFDLEVIVVDDGSSGETADVIMRYPIGTIRTEGVGMANARTIGLEAATGDYFTLLDDDDVLLPTAISTQLRVFAERPEYAAVHAQALLAGPDLAPFGDPVPAGPLRSGMIFDQLLTYFPQVGTIVTRIDRAREAGPFDAALPGDNDWDWLLRIASRYPIGTVEVPVMIFRQRTEPEEQLAWRRFPAIREIYRRHTVPLPLAERVRLRPILWRHRGWCSSVFLNYAQDNWSNGDRRRAVRSAAYAIRTSPLHSITEVVAPDASVVGQTRRRGDGMNGPERSGLHHDPVDPLTPAPDPATWTDLLAATASSAAMECYRDALTVDGGDIRSGVVRDLADYYGFTDDEVVHRCVHWEEWSTQEWQADDRSSVDAITDFYRTTRSWSFDLLWFAYLQAELYQYPVSAAVATTLAEQGVLGGRHLDFGCGTGVTSQMFSRLGFESEMADISTSMLDFARFRLQRRSETIRSIDLNDRSVEPARYDVITAIDTLVHIPDLERVVRELHGALTPGGRLFANFAVRPRTPENSQFLYDDELPLRRMVQRLGFEERRRLDGMITEYERVEPTGWRHLARRVRALVVFSPLRPLVRDARNRVRSMLRS